MAFTIIDDFSRFPDGLCGAALAVGNFDGCHLGHQRVFDKALAMAREKNRPALVLTLEPHPRDFFAAEPFMFRLSDHGQKNRLVEAMGFDGIIVLPFDAEMAEKSADAFVRDFLVQSVKASAVSVGADFQFGRARAGTPEYLAGAGLKYGFDVAICPMLDISGTDVSSSRVRDCLRDGKAEIANALLGYHFFVTGDVSHGDKRGRELGYPTANLEISPFAGLKQGVYAVRALCRGRAYDGVASYGRRPMFDNGKVLFESHIFDFEAEIYGERLEVAIVQYLRSEKKFEDVGALIAAMDEDSAAAKRILATEAAISDIDCKLGFFD